MKKISLLFIAVLGSATVAFGQVGLNMETTPQGTLHIVGEKDSDVMRIDTNNGTESLTISKNGKVGIKTNAPTRALDVNGSVTLEKLAAADTNVHRHVLVTNSIGNIESINYDRFIKGTITPRAIKYATHSCEINSSCPTNSILSFGKIRVRLNETWQNPTANPGHIEFQLVEANHYSVYWEKAGSGSDDKGWVGYRYFNGSDKGYSTLNTSANSWIKFKLRQGTTNTYIPNDFNSANRDITTAIILLNNSRVVYRVTFLSNPRLGGGAVPPQVTIFIEELLEY